MKKLRCPVCERINTLKVRKDDYYCTGCGNYIDAEEVREFNKSKGVAMIDWLTGK